MLRSILPVCIFLSFTAVGCGSDSDMSLRTSWSFDSGDCTTNGITTVSVTFGPANAATQVVTFPCSVGSGLLGTIAAGGGTYVITGQGLDANGVARAVSYGTTANFGSSGAAGRPVTITLHPKPADVLVTWSISGKSCPGVVILPFFITLYKAPTTAGGALGAKVSEAQETCSKGQTTLAQVPPGDYVAELDSRAVTPAVKITASVKVMAGENTQVALQI